MCPVDAHCQAVLHQTARVLLERPWLVLGEGSYPDVPIMNPLNTGKLPFHPFSTFFYSLNLVKMLRHTNISLNQLPGRLWTFWFLNLLNDLHSLKMDLETEFRLYVSYVRLYHMFWIFKVLHYPPPLLGTFIPG